MTWTSTGLTNLRYGDAIVILSHSEQDLSEMIEDLQRELLRIEEPVMVVGKKIQKMEEYRGKVY